MTKPIFVLAPMADVTDAAYRRIIAKYGKPDLMYTEFVSADGLALAPEEGRQKLLKDLVFAEAERPIIAQFFTSSPENMRKAAELAKSLGFDGVDINMGCPQDNVVHQGAGACLIKTPELAREVIHAAIEGAGGLPVSVKTRLGFNKDELEEWLPELLKEDLAHITIHARTKKDMSKVPARWERVKRAVEIRNGLGSKTLILGNGDIRSLAEARDKAAETGADGVMIGRAIFGNPWLFSERTPTLEEKLNVMVEHTKLFEELLGDTKSFNIMKKHYKAYVNGFDGAVELRVRLMEAPNAENVAQIIDHYLGRA
ncbi:tRNA-dihydrouridine synthase [Candidatus Parcubacteria bacterium]|nr:tRNA-dihydrouridine synthase [Candidatus Parcubacteria bacterium]